jgi:tRNA (cmo5U34)-methyltransferase
MWTQDTSDLYRRLATIAVPARAEQIAVLLSLVPFAPGDAFKIVDLAAGEGRLSDALLRTFPQATLVALDAEESMRAEASRRLAPYGERVTVEAFDIQTADWWQYMDGAGVVVSSLCVHHLDAAGKQTLFQAVQERLVPQGAFLLADLVLPLRLEVQSVFAATWDEHAQREAYALRAPELWDSFQRSRWNYYRYPDPFDKPSRLFDQLLWMREAGFSAVDCFWMQAGHAIYGGYQQFKAAISPRLDWTTARQIASAVLSDQAGAT